MSNWFFRKLAANERRSNTNEGEQFKHDQQDENTYAGVDNLVCEVLQNSLDARAGNGKPVKVRFAILS
ncbi:MAG: hypothetical protein LBI18_14885, partial [Planctomycetaceae bacterium]|nr:hypothetical protein [Planctomycetaceae bacterium]